VIRKALLIFCITQLGLSMAQAAPTTRPASFSDLYSILNTRNIFSRSRSSGSSTYSSYRYTYSTREAARAQQAHVLTGIVQESNGQYMAFIEDTRSGETNKFKVGDKLAEGKLSKIGFDFIEFEGNGTTTHLEVGMNLVGTRVIPAYTPEIPTTAPAAPIAPTTAPVMVIGPDGQLIQLPPNVEAATPSPTGLAPATPSAPSPSGNSVEERLKQARLRELQK